MRKMLIALSVTLLFASCSKDSGDKYCYMCIDDMGYDIGMVNGKSEEWIKSNAKKHKVYNDVLGREVVCNSFERKDCR